MGLATGIDYSLFVVSRFRNERRKGRSKEEALRAAAGTSGKAVIFAGCTVVLAVGGMFLVGDSTFNSLGLAAIVVVVLAVLISVSLLPALLMMLADHIDRFSLPFLRGTSEDRRHLGLHNRPRAAASCRAGYRHTRCLAGARLPDVNAQPRLQRRQGPAGCGRGEEGAACPPGQFHTGADLARAGRRRRREGQQRLLGGYAGAGQQVRQQRGERIDGVGGAGCSLRRAHPDERQRCRRHGSDPHSPQRRHRRAEGARCREPPAEGPRAGGVRRQHGEGADNGRHGRRTSTSATTSSSGRRSSSRSCSGWPS